MTFEIDDELEKAEKVEQKQQEEKRVLASAIEDVRVNIQNATQNDRGRTLLVKTFEEYPHHTEYHIELEYEIKRGPFKQRKTRLIVQVFDFRKEESANYHFQLVVFDQRDIKLAKDIASILTLVYGTQKIKLHVTYMPREWSSL
jgi:glycerophosphoryl diester phosphodiesterase